MRRVRLEHAPFLFLAGCVALLPLAHMKTVVFGLPVYFPEWLVLGALVSRFLLEGRAFIFTLFPRSLFGIGLGLFFLGALLSFALNPFSLTGLGMLKSWFVFPMLFGLLLRYEVAKREKQVGILLVWLGTLSLVSLRSLVLFLSGRVTYDGRLQGDYTSPNFLAFFLAAGVMIALFFLFSEGGYRLSVVQRRLVFCSLVCILLALFLARSYGVWLSVAVATSVFLGGIFLREGASKKLASVLAILCLVIAGLFLSESGSDKWQTLTSLDARSSLASRVMIWRAAYEIMSDHPVFGIGVGRFQEVYLAYQPFFTSYLEWAVPEPHNYALALFLATGLIGSVGFVLMMISLGARLWRAHAEQGADGTVPLLFSLWALFFVYGLLDTPYFKTDLAYSFYLLVALTLVCIKKALLERSAPTDVGFHSSMR